MKLAPALFASFLLVPTLPGCGDSAQVAEDAKDSGKEAGDETEDAAEEVGDETEDAAEEVGDEAEDAADEVAEEGEEAYDDTDAALDCAHVCDEQEECDSGIDEDVCYEICESVTIDGEGNEEEQAELEACDECIDDAEDDVRCDADGQFVCETECAAFIRQ